MLKPHSYEKELKAIENRMNVKLTNAIEKLGDVFILILLTIILDNEKVGEEVEVSTHRCK